MATSRPEWRQISGVVLLDKASGFSSNASLQKVRRLYRAQKAGHTGSLDPLASGLLPVCLGEATKFSGFLLNSDKRYQVKIRLGSETDTADSDGTVSRSCPVPALDASLIEQVLTGFRGEGQQVPPMYSALKHQGQRLYELARRGVDVERPPRAITIHELHLTGFDAGSIELDVLCSKGTYIRSLAEDISRALGTLGHVEVLRRTGVGRMTVHQARTVDELDALSADERDTLVLPVAMLADDLPALSLSGDESLRVRQGGRIVAPGTAAVGLAGLFGPGRDFIGVGEVLADGRVAPHRLMRTDA